MKHVVPEIAKENIVIPANDPGEIYQHEHESLQSFITGFKAESQAQRCVASLE